MTKRYRVREVKPHNSTLGAIFGIPSGDLAETNSRLNGLIRSFNQLVEYVQAEFERNAIDHTEFDQKVSAMFAYLERLQTDDTQDEMPNGYLEKMFVRMHHDLMRMIDERFAQYGFTQPGAQIFTQEENFYAQPPPLAELPSPEKIVEAEHEKDNRQFYTHQTTDNRQRHVVLTENVRIILLRNYGRRDNTGKKITLEDLAGMCNKSVSYIKDAIWQLKQEGQL